MKLITNSKFYLDFSKWVSKHKFDEFGRPLKKNGTLLNGNLSSNGYPSTVITDNNGKARNVEIQQKNVRLTSVCQKVVFTIG